jgi:nitronate monooxygenase
MSRLPPLRIGDITIDPPILQGAMGAYISLYNLASAVSNEGALGVITSVGLGEYTESYQDLSYEERSDRSLKDIIAETRKRTSRPFGVNIMYALTNHDNLVRACVDEKVPIIVSGAGLPLKLPSLVSGSVCKMIPIVSSARAADLICRTWRKRFDIYPDAFIVEGPLAGGHLGYSYEQLENINNMSLEAIFTDVKKAVHGHNERIPIIVGGGIFNGSDIAKFLKIGASGVQMATRFIATFECDASAALKEEVINSKKEDVIIIKSPVKMPGRVIRNGFVDKILTGERIDFECKYKCLKTCDAAKVNYRIANALINAYHGNMKCGFVMAGANCYRVKKIVHVKELIRDLVQEAEEHYFADQAVRHYSVG